MISCKKCPYFDTKKAIDAYGKGSMIKGHCRLRNKFISSDTITKETCKDRAIYPRSEKMKDLLPGRM